MRSLVAALLLVGVTRLPAQIPVDTVAHRQQRMLDSLARVIRSMESRIDSLAPSGSALPPAPERLLPQGAIKWRK